MRYKRYMILCGLIFWSVFSHNSPSLSVCAKTLVKDYITYEEQADGYYRVVAYEPPDNVEPVLLVLKKCRQPEKVVGEKGEETDYDVSRNPELYVSSIADGVFRDRVFKGIDISGNVDIGAHAFENIVITCPDGADSIYDEKTEKTYPVCAYICAAQNDIRGGTGAGIGEYAFANAVFPGCVVTSARYFGNYSFYKAEFSEYGMVYRVMGDEKNRKYAFTDAVIGDSAFEDTNLTDFNCLSLFHQFAGYGEPIYDEGNQFHCLSVFTSIGERSFMGTGIETVYVTPSLKSIGANAFTNSEKLTVIIPDSVTNVDNYNFESLDKAMYRIGKGNPAIEKLTELGVKMTVTPTGAFGGNGDAPTPNPGEADTDNKNPDGESGKAPDSGNKNPNEEAGKAPASDNKNNGRPAKGTVVKTKKCYYKITGKNSAALIKPVSKNITSLTVPKNITVNKYSFKVTRVAKKTCYKCRKLKKVTIGNNVKLIGDEAFSGCTGLMRISFGSRVEKLGKKVLYNDRKLNTITFDSKKMKSIGRKTFYKVPKNVDIRVPKSEVARYVKLINKSK